MSEQRQSVDRVIDNLVSAIHEINEHEAALEKAKAQKSQALSRLACLVPLDNPHRYFRTSYYKGYSTHNVIVRLSNFAGEIHAEMYEPDFPSQVQWPEPEPEPEPTPEDFELAATKQREPAGFPPPCDGSCASCVSGHPCEEHAHAHQAVS